MISAEKKELMLKTPEKKKGNENDIKKDTFNIDEVVKLTIEVDKNLMLRVVDNIYGRFVDVRKYYKGFPTKTGMRIPLNMFYKVFKIIENFE